MTAQVPAETLLLSQILKMTVLGNLLKPLFSNHSPFQSFFIRFTLEVITHTGKSQQTRCAKTGQIVQSIFALQKYVIPLRGICGGRGEEQTPNIDIIPNFILNPGMN